MKTDDVAPNGRGVANDTDAVPTLCPGEDARDCGPEPAPSEDEREARRQVHLLWHEWGKDGGDMRTAFREAFLALGDLPLILGTSPEYDAWMAGFHRTEKPQVERAEPVRFDSAEIPKDDRFEEWWPKGGRYVLARDLTLHDVMLIAWNAALAEKPQADHAALIAELRNAATVRAANAEFVKGEGRIGEQVTYEHDARLFVKAADALEGKETQHGNR